MTRQERGYLLQTLKNLRIQSPEEYQQTVQRAKGGDTIDPEFASAVLAADKIIRREAKKGA